MTYNLDQIAQDKDYFKAINKLAEDELVKIASIMEGIIERQKNAQSSRASSAQSPGNRGRGATGGEVSQ